MNKHRNEIELKIGDKVILLRPTFENLAETESNVGGLSWLAWRFSRGVRVQQSEDGTVKPVAEITSETLKDQPSLTEIVKIVYYNQVKNESGRRELSLEQIFDLIVSTGSFKMVLMKVIVFIGQALSGGDFDEQAEVTEAEKKN